MNVVIYYKPLKKDSSREACGKERRRWCDCVTEGLVNGLLRARLNYSRS